LLWGDGMTRTELKNIENTIKILNTAIDNLEIYTLGNVTMFFKYGEAMVDIQNAVHKLRLRVEKEQTNEMD